MKYSSRYRQCLRMALTRSRFAGDARQFSRQLCAIVGQSGGAYSGSAEEGHRARNCCVAKAVSRTARVAFHPIIGPILTRRPGHAN